MLQYGAIWRRMELAHRQTEAHVHCGVMRGLAVAAMIDRSCIRSANLVENLGTCLLVFVLG